VKGYQFVGAHWTQHEKAWDGIPEVEPWFKENAAKINRARPFFFIQHCHPQNTVYAEDAWGSDKGYATRALSAFPNAIALSGHSHASLTDERSVWQGAFTSIGTSSLRYGGEVDKYAQRQGMLMKVYDDRIAIVRRDFINDASLGDDWVIPLPGDAARDGVVGLGVPARPQTQPYSFETRKATSTPPVFATDAKLVVKAEKDGHLLTIPCANAGKTRAFRYRIETGLKNGKGVPVEFLAWDAKYNMPRALQGVPTKYLVKNEKLPKGATPKFAVYPVDCFGNSGKPIVSR